MSDIDPTEKEDTPQADNSSDEQEVNGSETKPRRILIGSQRDPGAPMPKPRDWKGLPEDVTAPKEQPTEESPAEETPAEETPAEPVAEEPKTEPAPTEEVAAEQPAAEEPVADESPVEEELPAADEVEARISAAPMPSGPVTVPSVRDKLSDDLQQEFEDALKDQALDDLIVAGGETLSKQDAFEEDSRHKGRVVAVRRDDVFVELGSREQGVVSLKQFEEAPEIGATIEVVVQKFNNEDGLYELSIPNAAADVGDWSDVHEGMLVDARVTGHNTGGLECEVNHIRGFIPVSQISLYRVEDLAQFVGEKFICVVSEANRERRNLVLSRRAVLEREKEEAKKKLLESLAPGQIHEGVVRKIMDFGAFVDIGGVDGLLHISQLAWHRVDHPSEILTEGQTIKVKVEKVDHATGKIGFGYREMLSNPWEDAAKKYPVNSTVEGTVKKLMEFGAFVEVEPGVEGLVHISELSHKRVWRASDVVHEGDKVNVLVQSVDPNAQRMSLSMKATVPEPERKKKDDEPEIAELPEESKKQSNKPQKPLKGGIGRSSGGEKFGLKW